MPGERCAFAEFCDDVRQLAKQSVNDDAEQDDVGLQEFARVHRHIADAGRCRDGLGDDQGQPHHAEAIAQSDKDGGQGAGKNDAPEQREGAEAIDARHLDQRRVDGAHAMIGVDVDGEENPDRHEEYLRFLADAEPQNDQRNDRQMRDVAQHLQRGIQCDFGWPPQTVGDSEGEADNAADQQFLERPQRADADIGGEAASPPGLAHEGRAHTRSTQAERAGDQAEIGGDFRPTIGATEEIQAARAVGRGERSLAVRRPGFRRAGGSTAAATHDVADPDRFGDEAEAVERIGDAPAGSAATSAPISWTPLRITAQRL